MSLTQCFAKDIIFTACRWTAGQMAPACQQRPHRTSGPWCQWFSFDLWFERAMDRFVWASCHLASQPTNANTIASRETLEVSTLPKKTFAHRASVRGHIVQQHPILEPTNIYQHSRNALDGLPQRGNFKLQETSGCLLKQHLERQCCRAFNPDAQVRQPVCQRENILEKVGKNEWQTLVANHETCLHLEHHCVLCQHWCAQTNVRAAHLIKTHGEAFQPSMIHRAGINQHVLRVNKECQACGSAIGQQHVCPVVMQLAILKQCLVIKEHKDPGHRSPEPTTRAGARKKSPFDGAYSDQEIASPRNTFDASGGFKQANTLADTVKVRLGTSLASADTLKWRDANTSRHPDHRNHGSCNSKTLWWNSWPVSIQEQWLCEREFVARLRMECFPCGRQFDNCSHLYWFTWTTSMRERPRKPWLMLNTSKRSTLPWEAYVDIGGIAGCHTPVWQRCTLASYAIDARRSSNHLTWSWFLPSLTIGYYMDTMRRSSTTRSTTTSSRGTAVFAWFDTPPLQGCGGTLKLTMRARSFILRQTQPCCPACRNLPAQELSPAPKCPIFFNCILLQHLRHGNPQAGPASTQRRSAEKVKTPPTYVPLASGCSARMTWHLSPTCLRLFSAASFTFVCLPPVSYWVPHALPAWFYICTCFRFSPTCLPLGSGCCPHDITFVSHLSPLVSHLSPSASHLSPTCLPLDPGRSARVISLVCWLVG